jgi:hypothetical protein
VRALAWVNFHGGLLFRPAVEEHEPLTGAAGFDVSFMPSRLSSGSSFFVRIVEVTVGKTAGDYLCERLLAWGVNTIYGFPGDRINGILGSLRRYEDRFCPAQGSANPALTIMALASRLGHRLGTGKIVTGLAQATVGTRS